VELRHFTTSNDGVALHCVAAGPDDGRLVILLHGFPDSWGTWRKQLSFLGLRGFLAVAPDLRGYGESGKPRKVKDYAMPQLTADVDRIIQSLGREKACIVGHDWGAEIAWHFAMDHPAHVEKLAILNVPHPKRMLQGLRTLRQLKKSWYIFFFQLPWLPEALTRLNRHMRKLRDPRGPLHYYRAALRYPPRVRKIEVDTLVIWGVDDPWLGPELAEPPKELVPNARVVRLTNASHWVHVDQPDEVNALLRDFL
jgi:pimeloyl-ACP methyl ester carboxylesterase